MWFAGPLFWPYFLLQTGVGYFRVYAMASGLAGSAKSRAWKVTKKFGRVGLAGRAHHKPYMLELALSVYYAVRGEGDDDEGFGIVGKRGLLFVHLGCRRAACCLLS